MEKQNTFKTPEKVQNSEDNTQQIFTEIYKEIQAFPNRLIPKVREKIVTPERIVVSSPQINRLAFEKQDKKTRSKMLQAACEAPNIITLFHQNKMFVRGKDANAKFVSSSIPVQQINRNDFDRKSTTVKKGSPAVKYSFLIKDFKSALCQIKHSNSASRCSSRIKLQASTSRLQNDFQKNLCLALQSIEKQCEATRDSKTPDSVTDIPKKQKSMQNWTSRVHWTASKLQKWENLNTEVMKELYDHAKFTKKTQKLDADEISFDLLHKSSHEIREQAKFIKKILIKKKMKIL